MRKALGTVLLLVIAATAWNAYSYWPIALCKKPILYSMGAFDARFGLSQEAFLKAVAEAEGVWEGPIGKELFTYAPEKAEKKDSLKVNLVYDYRQKAIKDLASIENTLDRGNAQYRELDAVYRSRKDKYDTLKASYEADARAWEAQNAEYEVEVDRWNAGPRTSKSEFDALESARLALEADAADLRTKEAQLNALAKEVNTLVSQLNKLAKDLNLGILQYNEVGHERGETFTGGLYTSDEDGERIDIFEFETRSELVHLLAHELGHALGLDHVEDPKAIMYYLDHAGSAAATPADIALLKTLCSVE